jgi:hypothetical protein
MGSVLLSFDFEPADHTGGHAFGRRIGGQQFTKRGAVSVCFQRPRGLRVH